ncbi:MAG: hypothetical protein AAB850_02525 [Patescibacteria group bacterium]
MNINVDKFIGVISNVVIIYCFHLPVASLFATFGFYEIATFLTFPFISDGIGIIMYFIFLPIAVIYIFDKSIEKFTKKEKFTFWEKFRLIGMIIIPIFLVIAMVLWRAAW